MTDRAHRQETRIRLLPDHLQQPDGGKRWPRRNRTRLALLPALPVPIRGDPGGYAEQMGCTFRLASPSLCLVKIMRITGLARRFLAFQVPEQAAGLRCPEPSRLPLTGPVREVPEHG
jgi:hypothetical protein